MNMIHDKPELKKSILFIVDKFYPTDEIFVEEIYAKMIPDRGFKVSFIMRPREIVQNVIVQWHGNDIFLIENEMTTRNPVLRFWRCIKSAYQIYKIIKKYKFDIIQVRNWYWGLLVSLCLKKMFHFSLVYQRSYPPEELRNETIANMSGILRYLQNWRNKSWFGFTIFAMKQSDAIFPVSDEMKKKLIKVGIKPSKMTSVPYGAIIPPKIHENKTQHIRDYFNLNGKDVILYFGASEPVRKIEFIIDAFKMVNVAKNNSRLILLGGEESDVHRLTKYIINCGLNSSVIVIGRVPRSDLDNYIEVSLFTLSILPPIDVYQVCTPGKLFDSMVNAKAVIGNRLPFQEKILNRSGGGICIDYEQDKLTQAMIWMLDHPEKTKQMGERGKKYIISEWSFASIVDKMEYTYYSF